MDWIILAVAVRSGPKGGFRRMPETDFPGPPERLISGNFGQQ